MKSEGYVLEDIGKESGKRCVDEVAHVAEGHHEGEGERWRMGRERGADECLNDISDFSLRSENGDALVDCKVTHVREIEIMVQCVARIRSELFRHGSKSSKIGLG